MAKASLVLTLILATAACAPLPEREVFVPPYAEKGCWARFYEQAGYAGPMRQLEGPEDVESVGDRMLAVPNMSTAGIQPLFSEVASVQVGPQARVIGYRGPLFEIPSVEWPPSSQLAETAVFGKELQSFRLRCAPATSASR